MDDREHRQSSLVTTELSEIADGFRIPWPRAKGFSVGEFYELKNG
jgi:hypothetical protein